MASIGLLETFLAVICFLLIPRLINSYKNNGMPTNWPFIGMLPALLVHVHRIHDWVTGLLEKSQCTFTFKGPWFGNMDMLITSDPANIHHIMSSNFQNYPKGTEFKQMFEILGDGIFNSDFDLWKNQRRTAQALITHRLFYHFLIRTSQSKVEKGLIPVLEHVSKQGLVVDLQDLFQRFTFDATCLLVTGYDPGCLSVKLPEVEFSKALDDAEEAIFFRHILPERIWRLQSRLGIGEEKKHSDAWGTLDRILAEIIAAKRKEMREGTKLKQDGEGTDLLTSYMSTKDHETAAGSGSDYDDKSLRDIALNFMLAGRDTTSAGLSWFFWLLSGNPKVEAKIREELKATLPPGEAEKWWLFEAEKLKELVYLHGALCEALRLYPSVPFQHKSPIKPDVLPSGHRVNSKMRILFSLYSMGRMSSIWGKDCLEFKPERWITKGGRIKHEPSYKFLAFNAGPRVCLGKEVAFTQMKAVVAAIIYNYQVKVVDAMSVIPSTSIILHMKHGMKVKLTKRWAA